MTVRQRLPNRRPNVSMKMSIRGAKAADHSCVGGGAVSGIAPSLGGVLILLASTIAAIAEPPPVRKVGNCPAGM